jgi:hypothetical protein
MREHTMTKIELLAKINEIEAMGTHELLAFREKVYASLLDDKAKYFLLAAIDEKEISLDTTNAMIEYSEVNFD